MSNSNGWDNQMKRILIVGCCGSGKSTLSRKLSQKLDIDSISLDKLFWKPGWVERNSDDFDKSLQKELEKDSWIIDGDYGRALSHRLKYADTVIFLDFNRWVCTLRVLKRWWFQEGYQAEVCPQKVDLQFLKYVFFKYPKDNRFRTLKAKAECPNTVKWLAFQKPSEVEFCVDKL